MRLTMGEERVIVRGIRPEEGLWGPYQFPRPYNLGDRLVVAVHVFEDDIRGLGKANRWFESRDEGKTWREVDPSVSVECGLRLPNGDRIYFPMESGVDVSGYKTLPQEYLTPGYDFTQPAEEGTLPFPDGMTFWQGGMTIRAYRAERLPESLREKEWLMKRIPAGQTEPVTEHAQVNWPYLTRVIFDGGNLHQVMKPIFPRGNPKLGPDGAVWVSAFSGEGHLNPANGWYSPYYSAELFRSEDDGHTFTQWAHMEYEADGREYPYQSGGFSDSDFEFMPDGSMVWFFRSAWYGSTGFEWAPMYFSRSTDGGHTWSRPTRFAFTGILPRLCTLGNGVTLLCYARPGIFVQACADGKGLEWSAPLEVITPNDRSGLHNLKIERPAFHEWDGACNNPEIVPLNDTTALLFYSDFYYPDEQGVKRKTILCREIRVED